MNQPRLLWLLLTGCIAALLLCPRRPWRQQDCYCQGHECQPHSCDLCEGVAKGPGAGLPNKGRVLHPQPGCLCQGLLSSIRQMANKQKCQCQCQCVSIRPAQQGRAGAMQSRPTRGCVSSVLACVPREK